MRGRTAWLAIAGAGAVLGLAALLGAGHFHDAAPPVRHAERARAPDAGRPVLETGRAVARPGAVSLSAPEAGSVVVPPSTSRPGSLRVTVRGEVGPLRGATVTASGRTATTDEAGIARFEGLTSPSAFVGVRAAGHLPPEQGEQVQLAAGVEAETWFELIPGRALEGRVLDARTSLPFVGLRVRSRGGGKLETMQAAGGRDSYGEAVTDSDGRFHLEALPFEFIVTVWAERKGYERGETGVLLHAEQHDRRPTEIRLEPGGWLAASVRDPAGAPAAGAYVRVSGPKAGDPPTPNWWLEGTSDAEGRCEILGVPFGQPVSVSAWLERVGFSNGRDLSVSEREPAAHVDLVLRALASLRVRVLDPGGKPVSALGVRFAEQPATWAEGNEASRDDLLPGRCWVTLAAPGYRPFAADFEVPEGGREERELRVDPGARITGQVVDDRGLGLADVQVSARSPAPEETLEAVSARDGAFALPGVAGRSYHVGVGEWNPSSVTVTAPAGPLQLVVPRPAVVAFRLRIPSGAPEPAYVEVYAQPGDPWGGCVVYDAKGMCAPFPPGATRLRLTAPGYLPLERDVEAAPAVVVDLGELTLDAGISVVGQVVDGAGAPVVGAVIEAEGAVTTDGEGRFRLEHQPRQAVKLSVVAEEFLPTNVEVADADPDRPARIVLARGGVVTGRVLLEGGGSAGWHALIVRAGADAEYENSDIEGVFRIRRPAGVYRVGACGAEWEEPTSWVEVTFVEGQEISITLRAPP